MKEREGKDYNSKADVSLLKLFETQAVFIHL